MNGLKSVEDLQGLQDWFMLNNVGNIDLYIIAILLVLAMLTVLLVKRIKVPIVVGYVFLGIILSSSVKKQIPFLANGVKDWYAFSIETFDYVPDLALAYTVQKDYAAFPEVGLLVFNILLFTTAITEVVGPFMTRFAVIQSGESRL